MFFLNEYPSVLSAKIIIDPVSRLSKGFGFVDFANVIEYHDALSSKNKKVLHNKILAIK